MVRGIDDMPSHRLEVQRFAGAVCGAAVPGFGHKAITKSRGRKPGSHPAHEGHHSLGKFRRIAFVCGGQGDEARKAVTAMAFPDWNYPTAERATPSTGRVLACEQTETTLGVCPSLDRGGDLGCHNHDAFHRTEYNV